MVSLFSFILMESIVLPFPLENVLTFADFANQGGEDAALLTRQTANQDQLATHLGVYLIKQG